MIHRNTHISITVKDNYTETPGYRSIVFNRPKDFEYYSGDWIDVQFGEKDLKGGKTYSLSSSHTDSELMITFKDGLSEIKKGLATLKPGDTLNIIQYGNDYKFTLKPRRASTLIAGGVGIAPFRSMIKEMAATDDKNEVSLIYLNQTADFLFSTELATWLGSVKGLSITYLVTKGLKSKDRNKAILTAVKSPRQSFYIAGPEGFVESTEHLLIDFGVDASDIKIDSFGSY